MTDESKYLDDKSSKQKLEETKKGIDSLISNLLTDLSLSKSVKMTIKNRKDKSKHEAQDKQREADSGNMPSNHMHYQYRQHSYDPNSPKKHHTSAKRSHHHQTKYSEPPSSVKRKSSLKVSCDSESDNAYNSEDEYDTGKKKDNLSEEKAEKEFTNFARLLLEKKGWQIIKVASDGACLFRSVAHQIFGDEEKHDVIRKQVCDYMMKNREHFSPYITEDFDHYINRKRHINCHGNHVEIQAIAELYNRPVEIYRDNIEPVNVFHADYSQEIPIRLSYHGQVHYNCIMDPYNPAVGHGLGMPDYQPKLTENQLLKKAIDESEKVLIEEAMLRDKIAETDENDIEFSIENQIMMESYYENLKKKQKLDKFQIQTEQQQTDDVPSSSNSVNRTPNTSAKKDEVVEEECNREVPGSSNSAKSRSTIDPDLAVIQNLPSDFIDMNDDALLAMVLEQSRQDYLRSQDPNRNSPKSPSQPTSSLPSNTNTIDKSH